MTFAVRYVERVVSNTAFGKRGYALHYQYGAIFVVHPFREIEDRQRFVADLQADAVQPPRRLKYLEILLPHL
ncbi:MULTISPECIES: hypothetical protein [unclassified Burkholderia]|uniref:hypothetical protein n=1 Tax=unclassified Burkholderia TaxID=2613784 RepID=UPI00141DF50F|nr:MULTISPECIES: hypothetical protein [unclassified Burkholderia]NIE83919.1 hypothetical protein [Burkholderia sp. Tr-860]NIF62648.1 hypothetical protein [Burkholderia sp. Cy-647]NIF96823.1 hypothetical protein [Burkholderia sp. Ax-1720]